jgi:hypothetical protein
MRQTESAQEKTTQFDVFTKDSACHPAKALSPAEESTFSGAATERNW